MESQILKNVSVLERLQVLKDSADRKEMFSYPKPLGDLEVTNLKDEFTKNAVKLAKCDEDKKSFMDSFKLKVKPIKSEMAICMQKIRNKVEEVNEEVFLISDQDEGMMGYYNSKGILVYSRPLMPEERQISLVDKSNVIVTGTNN